MIKQKYYQEQTDNGLLKPVVKHIFKCLKLPPHAKVLDVGCGAGYLGIYGNDHSHSAKLYGLDIDEIALENYNRGYTQVKIVDIEHSKYRLPFKDNYFDAIIAKDFLEHILKPWLLVADFHRVLKPNGVVWAQSPHYTSQLAWIDYTHVRPFTKHSFSMMFKDNGFKIESAKYNSLGFLTNPKVVDFIVNQLPFFGHFAGNVEVLAKKT